MDARSLPSPLLELQMDLLMCNVGSFLSPHKYNLLASTCKSFHRQMLFSNDSDDADSEKILNLSLNVNQIFFRQTGILFFGSEEWIKTFGVSLDGVSFLSISTYRILHSPCPFGDGTQKVKETHALIYIPQSIASTFSQGRPTPLNMALLSRLCPKVVKDPDPEVWGGNLTYCLLAEQQEPVGVPMPDQMPGVPHFTSYLNWIECGRAEAVSVSKPGWYLFYIGQDHGIIPGSRGQSFVEHLEILTEVNSKIDAGHRLSRNGELMQGEGYEVLSSLEIAIAASLIFTKTGQRVIPRDPDTFSLTKYYAVGWNRIIVGQNSEEEGLFGFYRMGDDNAVGICSARRVG